MTTTGTRTLLTVTMPLPSPLLTPNLRLHWAARARHTKQQREDAAWYVAVCGLPHTAIGHLSQFTGRVRLDVTVRPRPRMKQLDADNCWSALKATLDGIADALDIDDKRFILGTLVWSAARTGELFVTLTGEEG